MHYTSVLRGFYQEWEALISLSNEDIPDVPPLSKNLTPIKWLESFTDCMFRAFGVRKAPLSYIIRENDQAPPEDEDPLEINSTFNSATGSVSKKMRPG